MYTVRLPQKNAAARANFIQLFQTQSKIKPFPAVSIQRSERFSQQQHRLRQWRQTSTFAPIYQQSTVINALKETARC